MTRRRLHAGAWWLWAMGLAAVATLTTNPLVLILIITVVSVVVAFRRPPEPWALGYGIYLALAGVVLVIRVGFRLVFGGSYGSTVLFHLPAFDLGGVRLGGPVTAESLLAGLYDGLRLATLVVCVGAANTLADPRRLLRSLPRSLAGVATAVAMAVALAPQLVESIRRVGRARRLRGDAARGLGNLRSLLVPVLEDTLARSLSMASSMGSRGYGRLAAASSPPWTRIALAAGMAGLIAGSFAVLSGHPIGPPLALAGLPALAAGLFGSRSGPAPTRYRPDPWGGPEWLVAGLGLLAGLVTAVLAWRAPGALTASLEPLAWPQLHPLLGIAVVAAALPAPGVGR